MLPRYAVRPSSLGKIEEGLENQQTPIDALTEISQTRLKLKTVETERSQTWRVFVSG